ncbi:hypothetical protein P0Y35_08665 [Kiritimatiellaeota bacterium B1221]|nr:hypothetical protein [Kiritimatiellaeota bacterium B1221]
MQPLSKKQKAEICILAQKAWKKGAGAEWKGGLNEGVSETALFRAWRREQQQSACGMSSLTTCLHEADFPRLMAHFCTLAGEHDQAGYWLERLLEDGRNRVLHILKRETARFDLAWPGYPGAICRRQYKCGLGAASEKQLWALVYTVRNRGTRKKKKPNGERRRSNRRGATANER